MKELLATVDSEELAEWRAYYSFNPWDDREDVALGTISAIVANALSSKKHEPSDFIADYEKAVRRRHAIRSPEEAARMMIAAAQAWTIALGGSVGDNRPVSIEAQR